MRRFILLLVACFWFLSARGQQQKFDELVKAENFAEAVKFEAQADKLTPEQVFRLGFAFYALNQKQKAITYFDKAVAQGNSNAVVPFYKGLALMDLTDYPAAIKSFDLALAKRPRYPVFLESAARANALAKRPAQAIKLCRSAIQQAGCPEEVFKLLREVASQQGDPQAALTQLTSLRDSVSGLDENYRLLLTEIGTVCNGPLKDYPRAIRTFQELTARYRTDYHGQRSLLWAYNNAGKYAAADSVFQILRQAFLVDKLPADMTRAQNTPVYFFSWRNQLVVVSRYYVTTKEALRPVYRIMLFDEKQADVERSLVIELRSETAQEMGIPYSLAERGIGSSMHRAYGVYWKSDVIPVNEIEAAVTKVLDETYVKGERSGPDKFKH